MKPNTDIPERGETPAARPLTVGELVEHVFSGNHGFVRSVEPDGTYTVEFSGPLVNAGYHRDELKPDLARPLAERITQDVPDIDRKNPSHLNGILYTPVWVEDAWTGNPEAEANVELIAETFSVTHETGRTPRQLAEDVKELHRTLAHAVELFDDHGFGDHHDIQIYRAVLAKTEPRKQP